MHLQPIDIQDTPDWFKNIHDGLKHKFGPNPNKKFTNVSYLLRLLYLESIMEGKPFMFIYDTTSSVKVVLVMTEDGKATSWSIEKPPVEIANSEAAQELFQIFLGLRIQETMEEHGAIFNETAMKLSEELAL
tara:strand:- start:518 stop:913 length:396 start_codon:yes stop_codon:yes gene_type:complete